MTPDNLEHKANMHKHLCWKSCLLATLLLAPPNLFASDDPDPRPRLLQALDGIWTARGDVMGKPVSYEVIVQPALQNTFSEIAMKDIQKPPQYEARVFLGCDPASGQVIAHWMDSFGPKYSIPHGIGSLTENTIEFIIPYASGAFKDTFTYQPQDDLWTLEIFAQRSDGDWEPFARYRFTRTSRDREDP